MYALLAVAQSFSCQVSAPCWHAGLSLQYRTFRAIRPAGRSFGPTSTVQTLICATGRNSPQMSQRRVVVSERLIVQCRSNRASSLDFAYTSAGVNASRAPGAADRTS
jgi:hypothetical protein